jgi:hypothetical protein
VNRGARGRQDLGERRSAHAAISALRKSGVTFRTASNDDGTFERWQQPKMSAWEVPKRNPHERRNRAPEWEPEMAAEIAELTAASGRCRRH